MKKRLLIISFNSLKSSNANGRTIINLVGNNDLFELAQLYFSPDVPDYRDCKYFRITDDDILKSLLLRKPGRIVKCRASEKDETSGTYKKIKSRRNNQFLRFIRQKLWGLGTWKTKELFDWINAFSPDCLLLFSGNNAFIDKIAWFISKKTNAPIILYNCEDYYLKGPKNKTLFAKINKRFCDKTFVKTMSKIKGVIYLTEYLKEAYDKEFPNSKSVVIRNTYSPYFDTHSVTVKNDSIVYIGNISVGREYPLCEIANCLSEYGKKLEVYGNFQSENAAEMILNNTNILYHQTVSYEECCRIMQESEIVVICECFEEKYRREIKYAFSTKIPDCLASGTAMFVYAPDNISTSKYIAANKCGYFCSDQSKLKSAIKYMLFDEEKEAIILRQRMLSFKNHSVKNNNRSLNNFFEIVL